MNLLLVILAAIVVTFLFAFIVVKFVPLKLRGLISILLLAATAFLSYKIYNGIMEPIRFDAEKKVRYAKVINNLKIIRDAEEKYKEATGRYTKDKNALISFIDTAKLDITEVRNTIEKQHRGGGIYVDVSKREEVKIGEEPVVKYFEGKDYKNMFKVPGTDKEFEINTGAVEKVPGLEVPVFEVKIDKESILKGMNKSLVKQEKEAETADQIKGEYITVGSLDQVTTGGNWPPSYDKDEIAKKNSK